MTDAAIIPVVASGSTQQISGANLKTYFGSYGNANVAANLAAFGSNPITTTGTITAGNLDAINLVINRISSDDSSFVTIEDGMNVAGEIAATGNITGGNLLTGGVVSFTGGSRLSPIGANLDIFAGVGAYVNLSTSDESSRIGVDSTGGYIVTAGGTWDFGTTGTLTVPATNVVPGQISTQTTVASEKGFDLRITAGNTSGCSVSGGDVYLSAGVGYNGISHGGGNVNIVTGDRYGNIVGNIWNFGSTGALTLPLGGVKIKDTVGNSVAFGLNAGFSLQGIEAVAIGSYAGNNRQGNNSVAIGNSAGAGGSVSTNYVSGAESPSTTLVVVSTTGIGPGMIISGTGFFGNITVVTVTNSTTLEISASAGFTPSGTLTFTGNQGANAVAIGQSAGSTNQGTGAVAIGARAGLTNQGNNSIILNATGANLDQTTANTFTVAPIRNDVANIGQVVFYNTTSKEITYGNTISVTGNITGGNAVFTGNLSVAGNVTYISSNVVTINDLAINLANNAANISLINGGGIELGPQGAPYVTFLYNTSANTFTSNVGLSAVGNITGGNLLTAGLISATGNITGGNLNTGAQVVATGNITGGNLNTGAQVVATGNITGGNLITAGLVSATGNVSGGNIITTGNVTGNTAGFAIGYRDIPQVSLASNVTTALTDAGKHYYSTSASNLSLTIANNTSVSWPVGTAISVVNRGTANITIAQGTGVSLYLAGNATSGNRTVTTYGMATVMNVAANIWMINGTVV